MSDRKPPEGSHSLRTFGCKVNTYDSGLLQKRLSQSDFSLGSFSSHLHILNTCAVTSEATKEPLRQIRQIRQKDPLCTIVVTGCAAQVDTELFANHPEVDLVVANSHKGQLEKIVKKYLRGKLEEKVFKSNIFKKDDLEEGGGEEREHTRSFLKIQDGCNSFCTFCVIPFARGKSRSVEADHLVTRVRALHSRGVRETVLTGIHIGDYEDEQGNRLEDLVEKLLVKTKMPRLRLSSLEPIELSDRLLELYSDSKMCPHFHMSVQSVQTDILYAMKRKYGSGEVSKTLCEISKRVPGAFVGLDIIAGFPGETAKQFNETYETAKSLPWTKMHVFPYSPRPKVYANKIGGALERHEILQRARQLRELSQSRYMQKALEQVGRTKSVLVLKNGQRGLSEDYWNFSWKRALPSGTVVSMKVTDYNQGSHEVSLISEDVRTYTFQTRPVIMGMGKSPL